MFSFIFFKINNIGDAYNTIFNLIIPFFKFFIRNYFINFNFIINILYEAVICI